MKTHHKQRTDSTHVLAAIRTLNRLELLGETFRAALNCLSVAAPEWLSEHMEEVWFERYLRRVENYRLPKADSKREALGSEIGSDGFILMSDVYASSAPPWLRQLPAVETLRQVWIQQFYAPEYGSDRVKWRKLKDMPTSGYSIHSPYDIEARYSNKRSTDWVGYKAHITEICDEGSPRLITHVHTTNGAVPDDQVMQSIHHSLEEKALLPKEHFMDGGYLSAEHLVNSKVRHDIEVVGPVRGDRSWQAKEKAAYDGSCFRINWTQKFATCPQGHRSTKWQCAHDIQGRAIVKVRFLGKTCRACSVRSLCTKSKAQPRELTLRPQALFIVLNERRKVQTTKAFLKRYGLRAGIESTHSQGIRRSGLRRTRYIGLAKTHLQHVLIALALNVLRVNAWLNGVPLAKTRISRFKRVLRPQLVSAA